MKIETVAEFLRNMTALDAHRLRDAIGNDDLQDIGSLLGVDIEDKRDFERDGIAWQELENKAADRDSLSAQVEVLKEQVRGFTLKNSSVGTIAATITTRSGHIFDYADPRPGDFTLEDIAWGLAKEGRYANQLPGSLVWNVAQHSCMVHDQAPIEHRPAALMHDSPEAFVKDMPKPAKILIGPGYASLETRVWICIADKYGLPYNLPPIIKALDWRALNTEKKFLSTNDTRSDWNGLNDYPPFENVTKGDMCPWTVEYSAEQFLKRAKACGISDFAA